jgi:hypothetical protein
MFQRLTNQLVEIHGEGFVKPHPTTCEFGLQDEGARQCFLSALRPEGSVKLTQSELFNLLRRTPFVPKGIANDSEYVSIACPMQCGYVAKQIGMTFYKYDTFFLFILIVDPTRIMADHALAHPWCYSNLWVVLKPGFQLEDIRDVSLSDDELFYFILDLECEEVECQVCRDNLGNIYSPICIEGENLHRLCTICCMKLYDRPCHTCRSKACFCVKQCIFPGINNLNN